MARKCHTRGVILCFVLPGGALDISKYLTYDDVGILGLFSVLTSNNTRNDVDFANYLLIQWPCV